MLCFQKVGDTPTTGQRSSLCDRYNIGYEGTCTRDTERTFMNVGQTSRTGFTRISQNTDNYRAAGGAKLPPLPVQLGLDKKDVKSWMWEHSRELEIFALLLYIDLESRHNSVEIFT